MQDTIETELVLDMFCTVIEKFIDSNDTDAKNSGVLGQVTSSTFEELGPEGFHEAYKDAITERLMLTMRKAIRETLDDA